MSDFKINFVQTIRRADTFRFGRDKTLRLRTRRHRFDGCERRKTYTENDFEAFMNNGKCFLTEKFGTPPAYTLPCFIYCLGYFGYDFSLFGQIKGKSLMRENNEID